MTAVRLLGDVPMYARFATGLPAFVRKRVTLEDARATIARRLDTRAERFLALVERAVYGHPGSPYLPLLQDAGCEAGDLRAMAVDRGLEATLATLRGEGVYVTFDEFKGRTPIVRNGRTIPTAGRAFDNPFLASHFEGRTSGSTGVPGRIPHDLQTVEAQAHMKVLAYHAHGVLHAPLGLWRDGLPSVIGVKNALQSVIMGNPVRRWFAPATDGSAALRFRLATSFVVRACRLLGQPVPSPERVPFSRADVVALWAEAMVRAEGSCLLRASPSMALRLGVAAAEHGIDLHGVTVMGGGEPVTRGKTDPVVRAGGRVIPTYAFAEAGWAGIGCGDPEDPGDVHFLEDALALVQYPHPVPGHRLEVDGFCLTTLLPSASRILLNVEVDDYGTVERRACGCPLGAAGFGTHLRGIASHRKLTGEGVTLIGSDMIRILEETLPRRFGGHPHHYQLHEREDPDGLTRLILVVDPAVALDDEREVVAAVMDALSEDSDMADYARALWQQARSMRVERRAPEWAGNGKYPPIIAGR